jgi:trehalose 6-phosphate phosphatase
VKYILARRNVGTLTRLAAGRALLAFDFDGTLAPIVADRDAARMRSTTERLFRDVCAVFPCAVISGRSRADVARRLGDLPVRYVVGDHGGDAGMRRLRFDGQMAEVLDSLRRRLAGLPEIDIENKGSSLAIHYRVAPDRDAARLAIEAALAGPPRRVRQVPGKCVMNVLPAEALHKGDAFRQILSAERAEKALYVGDDDTDEDVFRLHGPERPLTVRVGASPRTRAEYFLHEQREIDTLLRLLATARQSRSDHRSVSPRGRPGGSRRRAGLRASG